MNANSRNGMQAVVQEIQAGCLEVTFWSLAKEAVSSTDTEHLALLTGPQEYVAHLSCDKLLGQRHALEKALETAHSLFLGTRGKKPERDLGIPKSYSVCCSQISPLIHRLPCLPFLKITSATKK